MFLAGEEFADVHDTDYMGVNPKQQDPVQWARAQYKGNALLKSNVAKLIQLRTSNPALQRNEIQFFYFHPQFDDDNGTEVPMGANFSASLFGVALCFASALGAGSSENTHPASSTSRRSSVAAATMDAREITPDASW